MYRARLCEEHVAEDDQRQRRRERALDVLHWRIQDTVARRSGVFATDWKELRRRWDEVCGVLNHNQGTASLPLDEAWYAMDWCTALAEQFLGAEDDLEKGIAPTWWLEQERDRVFEKFRHLDAGLMSNGLPRRPDAAGRAHPRSSHRDA